MTPITASPFGGIEQVLLLLVVIMTLVGFAGGNPAAVIAPIAQLLTRLLVGIISLAFAVATALIKALITLTPTLLRSVSAAAQTASTRRVR